MEEFILKEGVIVENYAEVKSGYKLENSENILASVSFDKLKPLTDMAIDVLKSPIFFFAEIPCTEDEEKAIGGGLHKKIYYLDNCTKDVCHAILKRYGDLLFSDGLVQFGFGSHKDNSEIFNQKYQVTSIYTTEISKFEKILTKINLQKVDNLTTLWDVLSKENPGQSMLVEVNGETIYDMIENLKDAGLYCCETVEEL